MPDPGTVIRRRNRIFVPGVRLDPGQVTDKRGVKPRAEKHHLPGDRSRVPKMAPKPSRPTRRANPPLARPAGTRRPK